MILLTPSRSRCRLLDFSGAWQLNEWFYAAFAARQNEFIQYKRGLLDDDVWSASRNIIPISSMPLCKEWSRTLGQHAFVEDFCAIVDQAMSAERDIGDFRVELEALISRVHRE